MTFATKINVIHAAWIAYLLAIFAFAGWCSISMRQTEQEWVRQEIRKAIEEAK
jgi:amino acid permease